jgi:hypothetical protein
MDQARFVGLEGSSALTSPPARMGDDLFLNQPVSLLFVDSHYPSVKVVNEFYRPTFGIDLTVHQVRVVPDIPQRRQWRSLRDPQKIILLTSHSYFPTITCAFLSTQKSAIYSSIFRRKTQPYA